MRSYCKLHWSRLEYPWCQKIRFTLLLALRACSQFYNSIKPVESYPLRNTWNTFMFSKYWPNLIAAHYDTKQNNEHNYAHHSFNKCRNANISMCFTTACTLYIILTRDIWHRWIKSATTKQWNTHLFYICHLFVLYLFQQYLSKLIMFH